MKKIFSIFKHDLKKIFRSVIAFIVVSVQHILFVLFAVTSLMAVRLRLKALAMARLALHQEETMALAMTQFSSQMITKPLQSFQAYKRMQ